MAELDRLLNTHVHRGGSVPLDVLVAAQAERGMDTRRVGKSGYCSFVYRLRSGERTRFMVCDTSESGEEGGR
ncbi:hypothetical protein N9H93_00130 [Rhizobiaceae bacterium]|nr:hypothetical protein [Rhizobiaceae bacterium]